MRDNLFIRINQLDPNSVDSIVANKTRCKVSVHGALSDLKMSTSNKRVILIIDSFDVLLSTTTIPTRNKQRLLKAIPFTLEEYLVQDPDTQIFALAPHYSNTEQSVAIVDRNLLNEHLDLLKKYNIRTEIVVTETFLLPIDLDKTATNTWVVTNDHDKFVIRTGRFSGFSIDNNNLETLFSSKQFDKNENNSKKPDKIVFIHTKDNPEFPDANKQAEALWTDIADKHNIESSVQYYSGDVLSLYAKSYSDNNSINLLQEGSKRQQRTSLQWKQWKVAAIAALVLLGIQAIFIGFEYQSMSNEAARLKAETRKIFKQAFPSARRFVKMRLRMRTALSQVGGTPSQSHAPFMELLGLTGNTIRKIGSLKLSTVNFRNGKLNIHFTVNQANKIDILEQGLKASGLMVSRGASNKTTQGYTGVLSISGKGSKP